MNQTLPKYNYDLDVMKALLVVGMIADHALMLLASKPARTALTEFKGLIDLVSFSGFLFCFGYSTWLSYFSAKPSFRRVLPSALRPLIAYFVSAFFYQLFVARSYGTDQFKSILFLARLAPFAEFLLAFSLVLVLGWMLQKPIARLLEHPRWFVAVMGLLLLTPLLPNQWVRSPLLSLFVGAPKEVATSFPVLEYFPLYLMGAYAARYEIKPNLWIGLAGMAGFYAYRSFAGGVTRFPAEFMWVFGSMFFVVTWYAVARFLTRWPITWRVLGPIGYNSLFYLVASNVLIFAFRGAMPRLGGAMNVKMTIEVALGIIAVLYFFTTLIRSRQRGNDTVTGTPRSA